MRHGKVSAGLKALLRDTRQYADSIVQKIEAMHSYYLRGHSKLYGQIEREHLDHYLAALRFKFYLATLSLEQLWAMSHTKRDQVVPALQNSLDRLECSDDELLLQSFLLEGFLFMGRAFLDFYMLYVALLLRTGHKGSMRKSRFFKALDKIKEGRFAERATKAEAYFQNRVFCPDCWGTRLESLRDKIAHRDIIRPSFESDETLIGQVLFDWPTIKGITYDRFCQEMQNGMFSLFTELSPVLYELEWKPGPYRPDLWA